MRRAPFSNSFFRPEEEHVASGKDNVVPPLGRRNKAVKQPVRRLRALEAHIQVERLAGLRAARVNRAGLVLHAVVERRWLTTVSCELRCYSVLRTQVQRQKPLEYVVSVVRQML